MSESYPIMRNIILGNDSQRVIHEHVLHPDEELLTFHPTDGTTLHCTIPGRKRDGRARIPWYLAVVCYPFIAVFVLIKWAIAFITDDMFNVVKNSPDPEFFATGSHRNCRAAQLAGLNSDGDGIWFVTHHRLGLVSVNHNRRQKRNLASAQENSTSTKEPKSHWNAALYAEIPAREFRVEGPFDRDVPGIGKGRPGSQRTVYRLLFHDGSEFDIPLPDSEKP